MELKNKDIEIIYLLSINSKLSVREISGILNISKSSVQNKILYLKENNVIKDFNLQIDYSKLNFIEFNIFIKIKNYSKEKLENLIKYLEQNDNSTWIGKSFGKYDLKVSFMVLDFEQISLIISNISSKFSDIIDVIDNLYIIEKYKTPQKYFLSSLFNYDFSINNYNKKSKKETKTLNLDNLDKQILFELGNDPNLSYVKLSNKLKQITAQGIKFRVNRLEKSNIITGNSIVLNGNQLNKIWSLVLININENISNEFKSYLKNNKNLTSYTQNMGIWNFTLTFFASDLNVIYKNVNELRENFSKDLKDLEVLTFFDLYKYPKKPKCILE